MNKVPQALRSRIQAGIVPAATLEHDRLGWKHLRFDPKRESYSKTTESMIVWDGSIFASIPSVNHTLKQQSA
ncbi:MAG TPA: hypothetical protein VMX97_18080 [Hyphomicrobiaceae bacterium]|nr:hypothetical protein [Hyphomicrobiaceae bacterium]